MCAAAFGVDHGELRKADGLRAANKSSGAATPGASGLPSTSPAERPPAAPLPPATAPRRAIRSMPRPADRRFWVPRRARRLAPAGRDRAFGRRGGRIIPAEHERPRGRPRKRFCKDGGADKVRDLEHHRSRGQSAACGRASVCRSGRPAHTPIVTSPVIANRPEVAVAVRRAGLEGKWSAAAGPRLAAHLGGAGASARMSLTYHAASGPKIAVPRAGGSSVR